MSLRTILFAGALAFGAGILGNASDVLAEERKFLQLTQQQIEACQQSAPCREKYLTHSPAYVPPAATTVTVTDKPTPVDAPVAIPNADAPAAPTNPLDPALIPTLPVPMPADAPASPAEGRAQPEYGGARSRATLVDLQPKERTTEGNNGQGAESSGQTTVDRKQSAEGNAQDLVAQLQQQAQTLQGEVQKLQQRVQVYLSSRQAALGIAEGFEQIDGNYGLFTEVTGSLRLEDWIAVEAGMQVSYATHPFVQTKTASDSGVRPINDHLQDRWSYSRTDQQSNDNALSWTLQALLGSLDRDTFGVKDLDFYLALGGRVRLVSSLERTQEKRTSQLLYRGSPRDPLHHQSIDEDGTLVPHLIPTAGVGACYGVATDIDTCAEFNAGLRGSRLETDGSVGLRIPF